MVRADAEAVIGFLLDLALQGDPSELVIERGLVSVAACELRGQHADHEGQCKGRVPIAGTFDAMEHRTREYLRHQLQRRRGH